MLAKIKTTFFQMRNYADIFGSLHTYHAHIYTFCLAIKTMDYTMESNIFHTFLYGLNTHNLI